LPRAYNGGLPTLVQDKDGGDWTTKRHFGGTDDPRKLDVVSYSRLQEVEVLSKSLMEAVKDVNGKVLRKCSSGK
jgi:hypothetical protein